ncbi:MAG: hypothetical protein ACLFRV_03910 [Acidimicrobiales bacterium]
MNRDTLARRVRQQYPAYSWLLDVPEVGELLLEAVDPDRGFDEATMAARLHDTTWWQNHSESMRQWDTLKETDPATADQQLFHARARVQMRANQLGVKPDEQWVTEIAEMSNRMGWTAQQTQVYTDRILVEQVQNRDGAGEIGAHEDQARALASRYLVPLSDQEATRTAERVISGDETWDGVVARFTNQARAMFPHMSDQIDAGATPADVAEPYRQIASQTLEVAPEAVDFTDPKYLAALRDGEGGGQMSLSEWQNRLHQDRRYGWQRTNQARTQAYETSAELLRSMGAIR